MKAYFRIVFFIFAFVFPQINAQERTINEIIDGVYTILRSDSIIDVRGSNAANSYKAQMQVSDIQRNNTTYLYVVNMPDLLLISVETKLELGSDII